MATNNEIIRDALGLLGVLRETESPSAEQGDHGLRILNELLEQWAGEGIEIGQWPQTDVNDTSPLDIRVLSAVKANLAVALSPYYGIAVAPTEMERAGRLYRHLLRDVAVNRLQEADMTHLPGVYGDWNILTGS